MTHTIRVRVILGGLLAGVVINVVEYVTNGIVLREAWGRAMQVLDKPAHLSASAIVIFNVWGFLLGIAAVWIYAAIRPRYGAGPITAVRGRAGGVGTCGISGESRQLPLGSVPHAAAGDNDHRGVNRNRGRHPGRRVAISKRRR